MQQLPSKKRKLSAATKEDYERPLTPSPQFSTSAEPSTSHSVPSGSQSKLKLQQMVLGQSEYSEAQKEPGKYLALDCEMVGIGVDGSESSLARVSLVNYHGAIILDEFVGQKERVVDYRTQWSGIRPKDLVDARPFGSVQKQVSNLLKGKVLVGHAVHNDLKVLLLSHAHSKKRDTQYYAYKFGVCKSGRVSLRDLVKQELELIIQSGEHSSVTDARAAMAVYRLHQNEWEKGIPRNLQLSSSSVSEKVGRKGVHVGSNPRPSARGKYVHKEQGQTEGETITQWWTQLPAIASDDHSRHGIGYGSNVSDWAFGFQEWPDTD